jgi:L-histidine Nalpha-methyltransferase
MEKQQIKSDIQTDTLRGFLSEPKFLLSKYFYDDKGTAIFRDIMNMPEYYITGCEHEIFTTQKDEIVKELCRGIHQFNLIEFGSGDGFKTRILLRMLAELKVNFTYIPVDISEEANSILSQALEKEFAGVKVNPLTGDYLEHIKSNNGFGPAAKMILFLGANIGNFSDRELEVFLNNLTHFTRSGDKMLMGFDLKKSPEVIMNAYNDPHGHTRSFNLNLLERLNRELDAQFDIKNFDTHIQYNPETGEVKSFLVSQVSQQVYVGAFKRFFQFEQWETIYTELSRKFDMKTIKLLAYNHGFRVVENFYDRRKYFVDSLWEKV